MRRVDFLGVPGVGKSTLFAGLREWRHRNGGRWLADEEARMLVARRLARAGGLAKRLASIGLRVPRLRKVLMHHVLASGMERALRGDREVSVYLELWLETFAAVLPPREQALALVPWVHRTGELALLNRYLDGRTVVFDESYTKLTCGSLTQLEAPEAVVAEFFRRTPAPAALIWLRASDPDRVGQRLIHRLDERRRRDAAGRLRFGERWWHDEELVDYVNRRMLYDTEAARILEERGVPVLPLNSRAPLEQQAKEVERFLGTLYVDSRPTTGVER